MAKPEPKKDTLIRSRVSEDLKKRIATLAKKRLSNEGQIVREAVAAWLDKETA